MSTKTLIVYNSKILFEILNEIKLNLNLEILNTNNKNFHMIDLNELENYTIISLEKSKNIKNCLILDNLPINLSKLLEIINLNFLKSKFINQSDLKIGKYHLDINSRIISFEDKNLNLTEKETDLIIYINKKKNVSLKELQNEVWKYSSNLETHTVETHIYRLRKKMIEIFDDDFINHDKKGYSII